MKDLNNPKTRTRQICNLSNYEWLIKPITPLGLRYAINIKEKLEYVHNIFSHKHMNIHTQHFIRRFSFLSLLKRSLFNLYLWDEYRGIWKKTRKSVLIYIRKADTSNNIGGERKKISYSGCVWGEFQGIISAGGLQRDKLVLNGVPVWYLYVSL